MKRAYSTLEIKATSESGGKRTFTGIASTPSTDRMGDIVEPKGAQFKLPIPLLWQHDSRQPIGWVTAARITDNGIEVQGEVADIQEEGTLKQRLTEAWQMLKNKLVRGLSIGFNAIEQADIKGTWGVHFLQWEWLELSAVTIPANQDASITTIKSIDNKLLAASGHGQHGVAGTSPGASGKSNNPKGHQMKTLQQLRDEREQKLARMKELQTNSEAADIELSADESQEFDALELEVKELDKDIRKARFDYLNSGNAIEVKGQTISQGRARSTSVIASIKPEEKFEGQFYTQMIIAKAFAYMEASKGNYIKAVDVAEKRWGKTNPTLVDLMKANEIQAGSSISGEWGAELVQADARYTGDFIEFLTSKTIYDRLPLRPVPANVTIKGQDGTATGYWVGQTKPIPASAQDFNTVSLTPLKVAALAPVSNEWLRDSTPSGEMLIRDALVDASSQRIDTTFLGTGAAVSNVSPAGILNGLTAGTSSGTDAAGVIADIKALYRNFITYKNASGLQLVMHPAQAKAISLMITTLGNVQFPGIGAMGGTLLGDPVVTGDNIEGSYMILLKPSDIYRIGDTGLSVEMSREATIEMSSAPTGEGAGPTAQSQAMVSMFQAEMTAIKVVRSINFALRRSTAVAYIRNVDYDTVES